MGNCRYASGADYWNQEVFYCRHCGTYYMRCPDCGKLIPVSGMPENGKTKATCLSCGNVVLYAGDYDMEGGA